MKVFIKFGEPKKTKTRKLDISGAYGNNISINIQQIINSLQFRCEIVAKLHQLELI